jgi:pyruvate,water dikinase
VRNLFAAIFQKWRERRLVRAAELLEALKIRYHTFRILLANNEYALDLMRSLDQSLRSGSTDLPEVTEELLSVTYELVDGLDRLSEGRHQKLFETHHNLARAIREALDTLMAAGKSHGPSCIFLDDLTAEFRGEVGGKAAPLAQLRKAGFPVPDGFSVTASACEGILSANGNDLFIRQRAQRLEAGYNRGADFEADAEEIRQRILDGVLPEGFEKELRTSYERLAGSEGAAISVRSSALVEDRPEHSFAGQFKSVLNVTSFDALKQALREVIASNYSARSISYRLHAGLSLARHDMAVLCQRMVQPKSAGILFTIDPALSESGRMLISAVNGLGVQAVDGSAPADIYRPLREGMDTGPMSDWAQIAEKTHRAAAKAEGGIEERELSETERNLPVLSEEEIRALVRLSRRVESLIGRPQDIEWAISEQGDILILQSRDIRLALKSRQAAEAARGEALLRGGVCASPGRSVGKVKIVRSTRDLEAWRQSAREPSIMVLPQSMTDAAGWLPGFEGVVVDLGNPADHLACVAREYSLPMLTGAGKATEVLRDGQWVILDADRAMVLKAPEEVWSGVALTQMDKPLPEARRAKRSDTSRPGAVQLRQIIEPLNLTDAYGPTFSVQECRSLHDLIRYTHEMAVLAMFQTGDDILESAEVLVRRLESTVPLHFLMIDLGGGITQTGSKGFKVRLEDIVSLPLLALLRGISTPGLRWSQPPPAAAVSGLFSRSLLDAGSARPVGRQNYALITRDYLNLNARVDYHFAMVDAVCGMNPRENYIRFRFKGGGTIAVQRERRARFIADVLVANHFFVDQRSDLVTASILETGQSETEERLVMLGRLFGFSRLLDATMRDDTMRRKVADAFLDGDYALDSLKEELAGA